ncbi:MAG: pirin family protein [Flavisolibacter sp.]|nr:pirin family protein [Flavisolibacter sp.]
MTYRSIKQQSYAHAFQMGPLRVKQPLPAKGLEQVSPFLLLHHAGPQHHEAGQPRTRLNPHPHRGFEPVTFLFSGKIHHKDSLGNEGFLESGDVQWMTAGSGIIHSEGPSEAFAKEGGDLELIQLWVNLPRQYKMTAPKYQDIKKDTIPTVIEDDGKIIFHVVAGTYKEKKGPANTFTPITAMMVYFEEGAHAFVPVPENFNTLVYVLNGAIHSNNQLIEAQNMAVYNKDGEGIELRSTTKGRLLFLAGEPIKEPMVSQGPFVMNYPAEIKQAILDYESGRMGILES